MTKFYLYVSRYLTALLFLTTTIAWSQSTVTGKVTSSDDGSGIPGVNVLEKGTSNGTVTDVEGNYSITVPNNATLVYSFVGYASQEVAVDSRSAITISLVPDVTALSEVVVIGYGEVNKRDATGAVASVKASDFNRGVIASPEQLIQGKTAGVQITSSSGEPGGSVNIRIRGTSSVRGGNNPLFVVDGIPLSGDNTAAGGADFGRGMSTAKNPLNFINPNDIESIDILKDASATAIYGSRGANGVVIITTKSGKGKKAQLEYNTTLSISNQARKYKVLNADQYLAGYAALGGDVSIVNFHADTNWQDEINRTGVSHAHNISYGDSYKTGNYRASVSYDNMQGIIKNSGMERFTGRLNWNQGFLQDKLKLGVQTLFSRVNDENPFITNTSGFEGDLIGASIFYNPTIPATPSNRNEATGVIYNTDAPNPLTMLEFYKDVTKTDRQLINVSLGYDITKELNVKINTGLDRSQSLRTSAMSGLQSKISNVASFGRATMSDQDNNNNLLELFANYKKTMGENSLTILAGYSYQSFEVKGRSANAANFYDHINMDRMIGDLTAAEAAVTGGLPDNWSNYEYQKDGVQRVYSLDNLTVTETPVSNSSIFPRAITGRKFNRKDELQSFFARGNYNVGEKYFFTASVRADGSTKFGPNNKYGVFPSAAVKWRMSEEDFTPEAFDDLSFRVGYGITGNQEIPHNLYEGRYYYGDQFGNMTLNNNGTLQNPAGLFVVAYDNPDLKWEETAQLNVGLDFAFLNSRLTGSLDFYNKNTTNLLIQVVSAQPAPNNFIWKNLDANVINTGIELNLNGVLIDRQNYGFNLGFNIAYNKNNVKNYNSPPLRTGAINGQGLTNAYAQAIANNHPLFSYYVREWTGYDASGLSNDASQAFVGKTALPKINSGISLSFRVYRFDLAAYMYGQFGQYVYNNVANAYFTKGALAAGRNVIPSVVSSNESPANSPDVSTRFLEKGDFIRMQNLSLGYSVDFDKKYLVKKVRMSATAQNLFLITDYSGRDPEVNVDKNIDGVPSAGIDYTSYPRARTFTFGLNATF